MVRIAILGLAAVLAASPVFAEDKFTPRDGLPMKLHDFRLPDLDGNQRELSEFSGAKAIVLFIQGNGCPIVRQSFPYMMQIRDEFEPKGIQFLMMNSNGLDDPASIRQELVEFDVDILTLKDSHQAVARSLDLERTAETIVIDPATNGIIYRGEADDRFGYGLQRSNPQNFYLQDVLSAWLDTGALPETRVRITKGCLMDLNDLREDVTYGDVQEVLVEMCGPCTHWDPEDCMSGWDESETRNNAGMLWEMLTTKRSPASHCCREGDDLRISRQASHTLISWLAVEE